MTNKELGLFALGAVCGSVATYFAVKNKYEKDYDQYRDELRGIYQDHTEQKTPEELKNDANEIINKINELTGAKNYAKMYGGDEIGDMPYEELNNIEQKLSMEESPNEEDKPYIISEEEFSNPLPAFEKVTLEYFLKDDILIDSMSHELMDVNKTISEENIKYLVDEDKDYIYVRNKQSGIDYEVLANEDDYMVAEKSYYGTY